MGGATGPTRVGLVRFWDRRSRKILALADPSVTSTCARSLTSPVWQAVLPAPRRPFPTIAPWLAIASCAPGLSRRSPAAGTSPQVRRMPCLCALLHLPSFGIPALSAIAGRRDDELKECSSQHPRIDPAVDEQALSGDIAGLR